MSERREPNLLVLGVGGLVGEAWMSGVLAGLETRTGVDFRRADRYVGTSAGAIVAAGLAAGLAPRRPDGQPHLDDPPASRADNTAWRRLRRASLHAVYPWANATLEAAAPALSLVRAAALAAMPRGRRNVDELHRYLGEFRAVFDGRLRIVTVDQVSGRRVVFGAPGAPPASVADAVAASCAVPGIYPPVTVAGRCYVDGGVWSATNLDAAEAGPGDRVLCLLPTAVLARSQASLIRGLGSALHGRTALEIAGARRRGATVEVITPDRRAAGGMGLNLLDRATGPAALVEGFRQGASRNAHRTGA